MYHDDFTTVYHDDFTIAYHDVITFNDEYIPKW